MGKIVALSYFRDQHSAYILQGKLKQINVESFVTDEIISNLYSSALGGYRLMIDEDDIEKAQKVLSELETSAESKSKKLVIFDLDGTLLNSLEDLADSANFVLQNHNYPTHPVLDYRYFVGDGVRKLIERILPKENLNDHNIETCKREFIDYYDLHKEDKTSVYQGVRELLIELINRNIKIAVATNKVHAAVEPLMQKYYSGIRFDAIFGQREGIPVKPDPQIIYDILEKTGCTADEVFHVGDTATDMNLAHNAGVECVGVTWGYRPESELVESGADYIINKPKDLLNLI